MKILVTGAAGKIGAALARELLEHGHEVRALDRSGVPADLRGRVEMVYADVSDRLAMLRVVQGCEAIAHLAAIPHPLGGNELEIFEPNVVGTQYVLAAAEAEGIRRVVLASSCSIYGAPFARSEFHFKYLPVDENHPIEPQDLYGLSKQFNELTAAAFTRRSGMATTCIRINKVVSFGSEEFHWMKRSLENSHNWRSPDFWHYIDVRDVALAFRLALEKVESGHHNVIAVARDIFTTSSRRDLIKRHYPELEIYFDGDWDFEKYGFYDSRPAEELFGFVATRFWRGVPELQDIVAKE